MAQASTGDLRLLSLDGGGVRGISSLLILEHLMEKIRDAEGLDEVPRPCDRFDMIGGTSTGGIIAIMLGRLRMTVEECIRAYQKLAKRAFTPKSMSRFKLPGTPSGAFSATALEEAIRDTVKEFCSADECVARRAGGLSTVTTCEHSDAEFRTPSCIATVVLAITKVNVDTGPTLFTTYDTSASLAGCTIWQVARATSAATAFFKPIRVGRGNEEFIDAGFGHNNPCEVLIEEAGQHFPGRDRMHMLSIGTGLGDVVSIGNTRLDIIKALTKMATSSKRVADQLDDRPGYVRFNVDQGLKDITLSDWEKASNITSHTRNYLSDKKTRRAVATFVNAFLGRDQQEERVESGGTAPLPEAPPRERYQYLPFHKNKKFIGRTSVVNTLEQKLFADGEEASHRVAIVGLGGVGKTQVALHTAHWTLQNRPGWHVIWVPALSMATIDQACADIARMIGLEDTDKKNTRELLRTWLNSDASGRWLLLIDNVDDEELYEQGLRNFLPRKARGRILFTTRVQKIALQLASTEVITLSQMEEQEATELMGKSLINQSLLKDKHLVAQLLDTLTYLPLAIIQAAAYLNETMTSVSEYIRLLGNTERDKIELLETEFSDDTRYTESQNAVAITWQVSFEQIRKNADAAMLLGFIAHIEPKAITRSILPPTETEQKMTRAIGILRGYSFLSVREDETTYDMHRLVHLASRIWVKKQDTAGEQRQEVLQHLGKIFSTDRWEDREQWRHWLPHVLKVIEVEGGNESYGETECELGYWVGRCLRVEGQIREAVRLLERVVAVRETTLAETYPDRLDSQHELARAYRADGRIKEAITLLERVVAVREITLAKTYPNRLDSQHELASAYQADGRIKEAITLMARVVAVRETTLAETHPNRLDSQHELASAHQADGRIKEAITLLERVVAVREITLAKTHPDRLASQHNLASAYQADGRIKEAITLMARVLAVRETTLAETHPDRLTSQHELARAYQADGRIKEAITLLERVVAVREMTLAKTHPDRLASQHNLASVYQADGRIKEAITLMARVLAVQEITLAETHPDRLTSQHNLATAYYNDGQLGRATSQHVCRNIVAIGLPASMSTEPRRYMSKRQRPCDFCRSRKTACRIENTPPCRLCVLHGRECTFVKPAPTRRRPEAPDTPPLGGADLDDTSHGGDFDENLNATGPVDDGYVFPEPQDAEMEPEDDPGEMFPGLYLDIGTPDFQAIFDSPPLASSKAPNPHPGAGSQLLAARPQPRGEAEMDRRAGANLNPLHLGLSGDMDPFLLNLYRVDGNGIFRFKELAVHSLVGTPAPCQFLLSPPTFFHRGMEDAGIDSNDLAKARLDLEAIISAELGDRLLHVFQQFILPQFPIFSVNTTPDPRTSAPYLLAAIYAVALPFAIFDDTLNVDFAYDALPYPALSRIINQGVASGMHSPNLALVLTLLLQVLRPSGDFAVSDAGYRWNLLGNLVTCATNIGLHMNPGSWSIPPWEIAERRRVAFFVFAADRWFAASMGRPPLIHIDNWMVTTLDADDQLESGLSPSQWEQVLEFSRHSAVMDSTLSRLYSLRQVDELSRSVTRSLEITRPILQELEYQRIMQAPLIGPHQLGLLQVQLLIRKAEIRPWLCRNAEPSDAAMLSPIREEIHRCTQAMSDLIRRLDPEKDNHFWPPWLQLTFSSICFSQLLMAVSATDTEEAASWVADLQATRRALRFKAPSFPMLRLGLLRIDSLFWRGVDNVLQLPPHVLDAFRLVLGR